MKLYKTTITVEVLSDEPLVWDTFMDIHYEITEGHCSGQVTQNSTREITEHQAAIELIRQGSDVNFLLPDWVPCPNPKCANGHVIIKDQKPMSRGDECYERAIPCHVCQGPGMVSPQAMKEWEEENAKTTG